MGRSWGRGAVVAGALVVLAAACSAEAPPATEAPADPPTVAADADRTVAAAPEQPLRDGERIVEVGLPEPYTPGTDGAGEDDYRCFLLDPGITEDSVVTGVDVAPDDEDAVHHVILFRVAPEHVATAEAVDADAPGQGWTCFGGSGLEGAGASLDDAGWLGAWAPGGGERLLGDDIGIPLPAGSRIVMQVHYSLRHGGGPDRSSARLRVTKASSDVAELETTLLAAPVELPCRAGHEGRLCDRDAAVADVAERFGPRSAQLVAGLQLFCGGETGARPGPTQSCGRPVDRPATVRAVAGHMHLLGRSIRIELNPGRNDARTLLDVAVWDFDDQGTTPLRRPARVRPGDELRVTCTHDQGLRDQLPAFEDAPERYVVWGEGTTDEMCLGIVLVTRP